jgi:hypothetical protein
LDNLDHKEHQSMELRNQHLMGFFRLVIL